MQHDLATLSREVQALRREVRGQRRRSRLLMLALVALVALVPGAGYSAGTGHLLAPQRAIAADDCQMFPQTGKQLCGRFLAYWRENGGLAQQGYPLSDEFTETNPGTGQRYTVQYFERARFELHPENQPPYDVLLGLLGSEQFAAKYRGDLTPVNGEPFPSYPGPRDCERFVQTGYEVCGAFLGYWQSNGGLAQQGLPISPLFLETNPTNGRQYVTQYFERARFEFHPELANTGNQVLLGLLGREQYTAKYPNGATAPPAPLATPAPLPSPAAPPQSSATPIPAANPRAGCDPSYPTICIPPPPPDLDCGQIPFRNFPVNKPDPHKFDADGDGVGCESR